MHLGECALRYLSASNYLPRGAVGPEVSQLRISLQINHNVCFLKVCRNSMCGIFDCFVQSFSFFFSPKIATTPVCQLLSDVLQQ